MATSAEFKDFVLDQLESSTLLDEIVEIIAPLLPEPKNPRENETFFVGSKLCIIRI